MSATANVTDGLRRTRQLLEQELERSSLSTQMLGESLRLPWMPPHDFIPAERHILSTQNARLKL